MFRENDYIVLLKGPESSSFPMQHIYKQIKDSNRLVVVTDAEGDFNGWPLCTHEPSKALEIRVDWRHATKSEELLYDAMQKPVRIDADMLEELKKENKPVFQLPRF